jgi:fumarylacetoacetase
MGFIICEDSTLGRPISVFDAEDYIFGMVLFNDWSARDIQKWEYVPLGPFLGKSFSSTISPWITPLEALEPVRLASPKQDPTPLPYLQHAGSNNFDIKLEVYITPEGGEPSKVCASNTKYLYWSMAQQLAHHTVNGCNLRPGDVCASGTISGPTPDSYGSMLELSWKGTKPVTLSDGSTRKFIQDGDTVTMKAFVDGGGVKFALGSVEAKCV